MKKYRFLVAIILFVIATTTLCGCKNNDFLKVNSKNVNEYQIDITVDEINHTAKATQSVDYINNTDNALDFICFHLYPNSFAEDVKNKPVSVLYENRAYPNGESFGNITIESVKIGTAKSNINKNQAITEYLGEDKTILKVELDESLYPNDRVVICFEYSLLLPNINHRFGYGDNTISFGNFYPVACVFENGSFDLNEYHYNGDPFYSDMANYNVTIKNYEKYTLACSGNVLSQTTTEHQTCTQVQAKAVRDFAFVLSDKFNLLSQSVGKTTINYYYYNDQNPNDSLKTAVDSLTTFSQLIGDYPYQTLAVVESNFVHGGMEYPNLVLISDALEKYEDYQNTIIHEIAHQWWYGMVGNNEYNYGWLDEGLTEFTTALFYDKNPEYNLTYDEIMQNANSSYCMFVDVYEDIFGTVDTSMNRTLSQFKTEPEYVYIAYVKGTLIFDSLREMLGEKTFEKCLRNYYNNYKGKNVTPADLIASFEKTSKRKLESFFNSWIDGSVIIIPKQALNEN